MTSLMVKILAKTKRNKTIMDNARFLTLLSKLKSDLNSRREDIAISTFGKTVETSQVEEVDFTQMFPTDPDVEEEENQEILKDVLVELEEEIEETQSRRVHGVARTIELNEKQQEVHDKIVFDRSDLVMIGAAGTGKTSSVREISQSLVALTDRLPRLPRGTKYLKEGLHGAAIVSFTRKAVNNIRHAVIEELKPHVLTMHKLLEFEPVYYEIEDTNDPGHFKKTMKFEPKRNESNPLPPDLVFIAFEESSMISTQLYQQLEAALPHPHQELFIGDIQQLPPVFGMAILGFKMVELEVVELTQVYRQQMGPILDLAWKILDGNTAVFSPVGKKMEVWNKYLQKSVKKNTVPALDALTQKTEKGEVRFQVWQGNTSEDKALITLKAQFEAWIEDGYYDPWKDIILCPFNVKVGTIELNKSISDFLGKKRNADIYEVIAGFEKHYLAVGDRVMYDKEDAIITAIRPNGNYMGTSPTPHGTTLNRWGGYDSAPSDAEIKKQMEEEQDFKIDAIDKYFDLDPEKESDDVDRVNVASHVVTIQYSFAQGEGDDGIVVLEKAGEINSLLGGHAITIHKFQGSEEENVFLVFHHSHQMMIKRELLYTAVTRAKKKLHILCEPSTFYKGVGTQAIKGNTIKEKAKFFMGKFSELKKAQEEGKLVGITRHVSLKGEYKSHESN